MPKNKGKGGKNRKRGKNEADDEKRELVFKEDGQEYAQVPPHAGERPLRGHVHRRHEAAVPHPREDAQEGVDRRRRHHPRRPPRLPGRQGRRHPQVHARRGAAAQGLRGASR
ncbi:Eukaryotic translation initiation factor 1A [Spatholobus suberectus]|nr:Eukaryotic translation initiation factor 1A [Spatholobus suberectus]